MATKEGELKKLTGLRDESLKQREIEAKRVKYWRDVAHNDRETREARSRFNTQDKAYRDYVNRVNFLKSSTTIKEAGEKLTRLRATQQARESARIDAEYRKQSQIRGTPAYKFEQRKVKVTPKQKLIIKKQMIKPVPSKAGPRITRRKQLISPVRRPKPKQVGLPPGRPESMVSRAMLPEEGGALALRMLADERRIIITKQLRGIKITAKERAKLVALEVASGVLGLGLAIKQLPLLPQAIGIGIAKLIKDPKSLKKVGPSIRKSGANFGQLIRTSPTSALAKIGTEVILLKGTGKFLKVTGSLSKSAVTKISPKFRGVKNTPLGIQEIKKVPKVGTIEITPKGVFPKLKVSSRKAIKQADIKKQLKIKPTLPKVSNIEKKILDIVKKRGDIVGGSFAQRTLLKKQFTRKFKDLDIVSKNPKSLAKDIKLKLGKRVRIETVTITDSPKGKFNVIKVYDRKTNKLIADLDPLKVAEEGLIKKFGTVKVGSIKLVKQEARLGAKVEQLGRKISEKKKVKVIRDIRDIFGKKVDLNIPAIKGAFGYSKKELRAVIGKKGPITTAQIDLLGKGIFKPKELKLKRFLFASPFDPKTGKAQVRLSRLGITKQKEAKLLDVLAGDVSFRGKVPKSQIYVFPEEKIFAKGKKGSLRGKTIAKTEKGFVVPEISSELEVVLGKGFGIKRGKTLATTIIEGKKVPIIEVKKFKIPKETKKLVKSISSIEKKLKVKKINPKQKKILINKIRTKRRILNRDLKKKTGFDYGLELKKSSRIRRPTKRLKPRVRIPKRPIIRSTKRKPVPGRPTRGQPPRTPGRPKPPKRPGPKRPGPRRPPDQILPRTRPPRTPVRRARIGVPGRPPPRRTPARPRPTIKPPVRPLPRRKRKRKSMRRRPKKPQAYSVKARPLKKRKKGKRPKLVRVSKVPLSKKRAKDLRNYITDTSLSRTARINPTRGKPSTPKLKVPKGYSRKTSKKFRRYRVVKGKRVPLPKGKVIERSKHLLDTRQEKKKITLRRRIAQLSKPPKRKTIKRKRSPKRSGGIF